MYLPHNRRPSTRDLILLNRLLDHPTVQISPDLHNNPSLVKAHAPSVSVVEFQSWFTSKYVCQTSCLFFKCFSNSESHTGGGDQLTTLTFSNSNKLHSRPLLIPAPNHIADFELQAGRFHDGA